MHYSIIKLNHNEAMEQLRDMFPTGQANSNNFVLFSTSGVHGTYTTIEEIEHSLHSYPNGYDGGEPPDDYCAPSLTFLIVQPRICTLWYGNAKVTLSDIEYLKRLRQSSAEAAQKIGFPDAEWL